MHAEGHGFKSRPRQLFYITLVHVPVHVGMKCFHLFYETLDQLPSALITSLWNVSVAQCIVYVCMCTCTFMYMYICACTMYMYVCVHGCFKHIAINVHEDVYIHW